MPQERCHRASPQPFQRRQDHPITDTHHLLQRATTVYNRWSEHTIAPDVVRHQVEKGVERAAARASRGDHCAECPGHVGVHQGHRVHGRSAAGTVAQCRYARIMRCDP
ncbi:hypothetical protein GCM10027570_45030 [Streptomonospora sediminis]